MFSKIHTSPALLAILSLPFLARAAQQPDGVIVPFTSVLPACASLCGKLFDVQGACSPPVLSSPSESCFCGDNRLQPFLQGTAGVESVCGAASCQDAPSLQKIENWYKSYCNVATTATTGATGATATSTGTSTPDNAVSNRNQGWFATHWKWVVMLLVMVFGLTGIWIGAILFRRRYIRKRDKEIEMRPPVAWGPHQTQNASGGFAYGDGNVDAGRGRLSKEGRSAVVATPAEARVKRESKGWLTKNKY